MKTVDARAMACPMPVVLTRRAVADDTAMEGVTVLVDEEIAAQNIEKMAGQCGWSIKRETRGGDIALIIHAGGEAREREEAETECVQSGLCVAIGSDRMGEGDAALGQQLLKAFLFALTQGEKAPETLVFYNGGAYLTCAGSPCLEDIRTLSQAGTRILTCGTCLSYYGLTDALCVGEVTNMYVIAGVMSGAQRLVKP